MKTEPNEPINPTIWDDRNKPEIIRDNDGLTKREYFAVMAMQGLLPLMAGSTYAPSGVIKDAIKFADDLINELNKIPTSYDQKTT